MRVAAGGGPPQASWPSAGMQRTSRCCSPPPPGGQAAGAAPGGPAGAQADQAPVLQPQDGGRGRPGGQGSEVRRAARPPQRSSSTTCEIFSASAHQAFLCRNAGPFSMHRPPGPQGPHPPATIRALASYIDGVATRTRRGPGTVILALSIITPNSVTNESEFDLIASKACTTSCEFRRPTLEAN